jgi:ADP-ribose pyrophosphatase
VPVLVPRNPVGRTGLCGRGHLGRWGPNHAADSIVTTWKRDEQGNIVSDPNTRRPILRFVSIQRKDTGEWAIPGGMRDPGEIITKTLIREFAEEALNKEYEYNESGKIDNHEAKKKDTGHFDKKLSHFFKNGTQVLFFLFFPKY